MTRPADIEPAELANSEWVACRHELRRRAGRAAIGKTWAEFGTAGGTSAADLLSVLPDGGLLYLHDTWEGLPEPWDKGNKVMPAGTFRCPPPQLGDRTVIRRGRFSATLPYDFGPLGLVHIDCDLYRSTRDALFGCDASIVNGTVLMFDELSSIGYPNWREGEYRALCEWRDATGKRVTWVAASIGSAFGIVSC
jgi:hypothetical protein